MNHLYLPRLSDSWREKKNVFFSQGNYISLLVKSFIKLTQMMLSNSGSTSLAYLLLQRYSLINWTTEMSATQNDPKFGEHRTLNHVIIHSLTSDFFETIFQKNRSCDYFSFKNAFEFNRLMIQLEKISKIFNKLLFPQLWFKDITKGCGDWFFQ